ncbi:MAG: PucR family transcriptional regulator ligand-binding domain-containing protein [Nocardioidaceae bacterium]|nr:PucR family transcriptional regulator ligand-binding domain-containing protein [Nocardioidaceae bacterium]
MLIPLDEVLALPVLADAAPEVVHPGRQPCLVRWVHSSEVFEMGPLLSGQELLLTTGLGLRGVRPAELEEYVDALADAGLSALALELGRTFAEVPPAIVRAARRRDVTLLAWRRVVPFEAIVEGFHHLVMERERSGLRVADQAWRELVEVVTRGDGLHALVRRIAELAGSAAFLLGRDGRVVAASDPSLTPPEPTLANSRIVEVDGAGWGTLVVATRRQSGTSVVERAAKVVGLELLRTGTTEQAAAQASRLLRDIAEGRLPSADDLRSRLGLAGFPVEPGRPMVGLCVSADRRVPATILTAAARRACRETFGAHVAGSLGEDVVLVTGAPRGGSRLRAQLADMTATLATAIESTTGHGLVTVAAGYPVAEVDGLAGSLEQSREVAAIARRLGTRRQPLLARDVSVYRLLARFGGEPEAADFVREQIGPLLDHDAAHAGSLVQTLDTYLRHGLAKTETAAALGIRRQTLYNRLDRIGAVLGEDVLAGYESRTALGLALHAWRLSTGLNLGSGS